MNMPTEPVQLVQPAPQETPATPGAENNPIRRVFVGPEGLRPGWRLAIFFALVAALRSAVTFVLHAMNFHLRGNDFTPRAEIIRDGLAFLVLMAAMAIMAAYEKRSIGDYGLPLRGAFGLRFFEGLLWGFVAECATMFTLYFTGNVSFQGFDQQGRAAVYYAVVWAIAFLMVGFFEESLFRGYPQFTLTQSAGFWPAALIISALFGLAHMPNQGETWIGGLSAGLAGFVMCVSLRVTGNLWFAVGLHASWDWAETYFFGVPDSGNPAIGHLLNTTLSGSKWMTGGTVGPEGSIVELLVVTAMMGLLLLRFRRPRRLRAPLS
ncbi:MAG TPA: CPBP family intramembrane glutamic endopeptidase [Terriglobales bacterium]|nr:CPBP family intramembrane glutamic endopeptidase [Terriglobales bacterium]